VAGVNEEGNGNGVYGRSKRAAGVYGESAHFSGVLGVTQANGHAGVAGIADDGAGNGLYGRSKNGEGVHGETQSPNLAAIAAFMLNPEGIGAAVHAENRGKGVGIFARGGRLAALFEGDVDITGSLTVQGSNINGLQALESKVNMLQQLTSDLLLTISALQSQIDVLQARTA
jgi:hypothetical protein